MFTKKVATSCGAVIVAAGSGTRMKLGTDKNGDTVNKVFLQIGDRPILAYTLHAFEQCAAIDKIVIVTRECDIALCKQLAEEFDISKLYSVVRGGTTRQQSVQIGLAELDGLCEMAAIHDGARCLIEANDIERVVLEAARYGAATLGIPCTDSLKRVDENGNIVSDVDRKNIYRVQTPQVFYTSQLAEAHALATADGFEATDDCSVAEHFGIVVRMVCGSAHNIKLTTQEDLTFVRAMLEE